MPPSTPFHDLDEYIALPRLGGLTLSPDGSRLVTTVSSLDAKRQKYVSALWEVDPHGKTAAQRLTHGKSGESQPVLTRSGDLLFSAQRGEEDDPAALWLLPRHGGEARCVATHPGGISAVLAARDADVLVLTADTLPSATDLASETKLRKDRKDAAVDAILHAGYPVRHWDHDLGPGTPRLYAVEPRAGAGSGAPPEDDRPGRQADSSHELRDLTRDAGNGLRGTDLDVAPDGSFVLATWQVPEKHGSIRSGLARIHVATGHRTVLLDDPETEVGAARISPDGTRAAVVLTRRSTAERAPRVMLAVLDLASGELRPLAHDWDRWPGKVAWLPDGTGLLAIADDDGRARLFHIDLGTEAVTRLTDEHALTDLVVAPDGRAAFALRASYDFPAEVVRIDLTGITTTAFVPGTAPVAALPGPVERPRLPGTLREVETTTADGTRVRSWLALPHDAGPATPAPLLLWIHGGPLSSWNTWSWRWCPWLMVAEGYAVLLPDPALSTGYGQDFIQRGWGAWGEAPYTDLMAITDEVVARADIDGARTSAMGGSFGGYMANWVAGHTERFRAIVTHASLWALDAFEPTTDGAFYWRREMTPEMALANSPHRYVADIRTPMLVIHGDKDYRVPIGEGLRLWYELLAHSGLPADEHGRTVHRFLYYPSENHWVLAPQHAKVWYQVILGFLAEHVLERGAPELPSTLG